jgi:hypothetical protein
VLLGIHLLTIVLLGLVLALPPARTLFGFGMMRPDHGLAVALAIVLLGLVLALIRRRGRLSGLLSQIKVPVRS